MSTTFQKTKEDFTCEHCGFEVKGTGYTNHCPKCLFGKHVDVFPGDRAETCGGLMEPVAYDGKDIYFICNKCKKVRRNKSTPEDNADLLVEISANPIPTTVQ